MSAQVPNSAAVRAFIKALADLGREDAFAIRTSKGGYRPVRRKIAMEDVRAHLEGTASAGVYLVTDDRARIGVLDLDSHYGAVDWATMASTAAKLATWLSDRGLTVLAVRSGGDAGIHLFVLFAEEQLAENIRGLLVACVEGCGLNVGTGGVAKNEVEVFPKQGLVRAGGLGNLIALPFARASCALQVDSFGDVATDVFVAGGLSRFLNTSIPAARRLEKVTDSGQGEASALAAVPNVPLLQPLPGDLSIAVDAIKCIPAGPYEPLILIGFALKAAFGEATFEPWVQWSGSSPAKFPGEAECRRRWDGFPARSRVGLGTIFYLARQKGWNGGDSSDWVREMNAQYGILTHATDALIILKQHDSEHEVFGRLGPRQLHDRLASEVVQMPGPRGAPIFKPKSKAWFEHPNTSRYDRLIFDPSLPPGENGSAWNMWTGFAFEPAPGDWSLLKDHIQTNICGNDAALSDWTLNWMADGVQNPGDVIGTAPVFVGLPGTGKSFLARAYGDLWGKHFVTITNHDHVHARFTGHLIGRRVIFVDEGTFGGNRKEAGTLKTRVTEDMIMHELKGVDPIFMPNRTIWLIASNEKSVVPADKADRRWQVFEVSSGRRGGS